MSETSSDIQSQRPRISGLAVASVGFGVLGLGVFAWRLLYYRLWWSEYLTRNVMVLLGIVGLAFGYFALARISRRVANIILLVVSSPLLLIWFSSVSMGLLRTRAVYVFLLRCSFYLALAFPVILFCAMAARQWKSWPKGKYRSGTLATLGIAAGVFLTGSWWMETCGPVSTALRMACAANNLMRLGEAIDMYANDNEGKYPEAHQWCDLLLQHTGIETDRFLCPAVKFRWRRQVLPLPIPKYERCYYAINPNCEPDSPKDTVLLFEITGGWNKSGGPELMTAENHRGDGCNVVFVNGRAEFVRKKRFAELNWGTGE